jgi:hypothetical protein
MHPVPTPEFIKKLEPNQIFVFGSNTEGRHASGAAWWAVHRFGAIYGKPSGLQGQCYAIITKDLNLGLRSVPLNLIYNQILEFMVRAKALFTFEFLVTKLGTELAGYTIEEIGSLFIGLEIPDNVRLPIEFINIIKQHDGLSTTSVDS